LVIALLAGRRRGGSSHNGQLAGGRRDAVTGEGRDDDPAALAGNAAAVGDGELAMVTDPLDLRDLLAELDR